MDEKMRFLSVEAYRRSKEIGVRFCEKDVEILQSY